MTAPFDPASLLADVRALQAAGKTQDALKQLDAARQKNPDQPVIYALLAECFEQVNDTAGTEKVLMAAHGLFPDNFSIANQLANFYYRIGNAAAGLGITQKYASHPQTPLELSLTHAALLKLAGDTAAAQRIFEAVLAHNSKNFFALANLGHLKMDEGDYVGAKELFTQAYYIQPRNPQIAVHLSHANFHLGNLAEGWKHYEKRFETGVADRPYSYGKWNGEKLNGPLLLWGEQGAGEEILYSGMIESAQNVTHEILVECDARLVPIFARSFPKITVIARGKIPDYRLNNYNISAHAPFGALGILFRDDIKKFPSRHSYLLPDEQKKKSLRDKYEALAKARGLTGKIIGLSWRSKALRHGDPKSTSIADWAIVLEESPHLFINLQYGDVTADLALAQTRGWNIVNDESIDQLKSLEDLAAQIAALDGVITVSNTAAHMAGALGVPGGVLLPKHKGLMWHWFQSASTSPWYPSLKLLRQTTDGDWHAPLQQAAKLFS